MAGDITSSFGPSDIFIGGASNRPAFPDPWLDIASTAMPETMQYALRWSEFIMNSNSTYRAAIDRALSYFITDLDITSHKRGESVSDEEKAKYDEFFKDRLGISKLLHTVGLDYLTYGNSFVSVLLPFRRYLYCRREGCGLTVPLREAYMRPEFNFKWANFDFHATCPKCNYEGRFGHVDRRGSDEDLIVKRWSPHEIEILYDDYTNQCDYIWKIPEDYKKLIRQGTLFHLERAPWEVIKAVQSNMHIKLSKDVLFHLKEDALAGMRIKGWGIPRTLVNFRQVWYVQVLHRYNEAIALDYVIPFRLITPVPRGSGGDPTLGDPLLNMSGGGFMGRVAGMLRQHRKDPAMWHTLPFPIQYQALGGDATQLAPRDLMDQGLEVLLNGVGIPTELYKGTLQLQSAPAALRLFESNWSHLVYSLNKFLAFLARKLSELLSWSAVSVKLTRVTLADDLNKQAQKLSLMMGSQLAKTDALKSIGIDYKENVDKMVDEAIYEALKQQELSERMQNMQLPQQMSAPPQQGDPSQQQGGGDMAMQPGANAMASPVDELAAQPSQGNSGMTPMDLESQAQDMAKRLLAYPDSQRSSELRKLKNINPTLHKLVTGALKDFRQQASSQGRQQILGQMQQQQ